MYSGYRMHYRSSIWLKIVNHDSTSTISSTLVPLIDNTMIMLRLSNKISNMVTYKLTVAAEVGFKLNSQERFALIELFEEHKQCTIELFYTFSTDRQSIDYDLYAINIIDLFDGQIDSTQYYDSLDSEVFSKTIEYALNNLPDLPEID